MIRPSGRQAVAGLVITGAVLVSVWVSEDFISPAYQDVGGVITIGPGRTGPDVKMGDTTTPVRELVISLHSLETKYADPIRRCIKVPLHQHEFDGLVETAYNAGAGAVCREVAPRFNAAVTDADYTAACEFIKTWRVTVKGKNCFDRKNNCYGLVNRRMKDATTCLG